MQDLVDDAELGGDLPGPGDDQEYVEFPEGREPVPKVELHDEAEPMETKTCSDEKSEPALHPAKPKDG